MTTKKEKKGRFAATFQNIRAKLVGKSKFQKSKSLRLTASTLHLERFQGDESGGESDDSLQGDFASNGVTSIKPFMKKEENSHSFKSYILS